MRGGLKSSRHQARTEALGHGAFDATVRGPHIKPTPVLAHARLALLEARWVRYRMYREWDNRTREMAHQDEICQRAMSVPGVGGHRPR